MNFNLTDEQRMLDEQLARLLADRADFEARTAAIAADPGYSRDLWGEFAELGLLALPFAEAQGGLGGGALETMLVAGRLGRALAITPYLESCILSAVLLAEDGSAEAAELCEEIIAGTTICTCAGLESGYGLPSATEDAGGWRLSGQLSNVPWGAQADRLIVVAATPAGPGLFLLARDSQGLQAAGYLTQDSRRAAGIQLTEVPARQLAVPDPAAAVARARDRAIASVCAEAVGLMESGLEQTVDYLRTRQQFGTPIGKFQALQHQAADMVIALEGARSMALYATMSAELADPVAREIALARAKIHIDRAARHLGQTAIQLHGGIGVTMELAIGHYFKRLTVIGLIWGDVDHHLDLLARAEQQGVRPAL